MAPAQNSKKTNFTAIALFAVLCVAGLRVAKLDLPFVEPYNSIARQSIVASVARNFYEHGFNFFYPEINENGRGPYLYNAEMPFYSYLMAIGYKLLGGVREWAARSVSVVFSLATLLFLFLLARRLWDEKFALVAFIFAGLSPLYLAISRSLQPEAAFLMGVMGAVYFFERYLDGEELLSFWLSALFLSFAVATKFFNAYVLALIVYRAWRVKGFYIFSDIKNYIYVVLVCASFAWYWRMWQLGQEMNLAYYPYRYIAHKAGAPGDVAESFLFWPSLLQCLKIFFVHILTPLGSVFFFVGFFRKPKSRSDEFLYAWFFLTLLSLVVGWKTVIQHSYYEIPLVLPCAFFVAKGFSEIMNGRGALNRLFRNKIFLFLIAAGELFSLFYFYKGLYIIPDRKMAIVRAGGETDKLIPKESLVVASHETSAIQLYYAHRRGWSFNMIGRSAKELEEELEAHRQEGAAYFLATSLEDMRRVPDFEAYLRGRYRLVRETPDFVLFDLAPSVKYSGSHA